MRQSPESENYSASAAQCIAQARPLPTHPRAESIHKRVVVVGAWRDLRPPPGDRRHLHWQFVSAHAGQRKDPWSDLSDILPTGFYGAVTTKVSAGSTVYIAGAGPVGLAAAASARPLAAGDMNQDRLAHATPSSRHDCRPRPLPIGSAAARFSSDLEVGVAMGLIRRASAQPWLPPSPPARAW